MAKRARLTRAERRAKYANARHQLSVLKSKGLISKRANLRRDKPSSALLKKAEALRGIFTGHAQAVKLSPKQTKEFREAGKQVYNGHIVFDKQPTEKIKVSKKGEVKLTSPYNLEGFDQIILPVNVRNFPAFYTWITEHPEELQAMAGSYGYFGFTFYGNPSRETGDAQWLGEYLLHYKALFSDEGVKADEANQAFQHLTLYRLNSDAGASAFVANASTAGSYKKAMKSLDRRQLKSRGGPREVGKPSSAMYQKTYRDKMMKDRAFRFAEADRKRQAYHAKKRPT